jgi:hypothetical protein
VHCGFAECDNPPSTLDSGDALKAEEFDQIAIDSRNVYVLDERVKGQIYVCPKTGCESGATVLATATLRPTSIATDGTDVYWTEASDEASAGSIRKCSVDGCDNNPTTLADGLARPISIALDATHIYWAESGIAVADGRIVQMHK